MIYVGTSGYNYPEWKGSFYPETLAAAKMLPYYAERFSTVEINYTFYRMPTAKLVTGWAAQVPDGFKFTLKAPKRITHDRRLKEVGDAVRGFCEAAAELGPKLGALLFQLPPFLRKDVALLDAFLETLPQGVCAAFEFRHASWLDDAVYERLKARNLALCVADSENSHTPVELTAPMDTSGCATKVIRRTISRVGLKPSATRPPVAQTFTFTSSMRTRERARNSGACFWTLSA